mmetsp:Transcript_16614/g.33508  ORF Transcript_16614/g.33508 Transcript_16614/m.33508 type:complete len:99 (+) Transcript_16614:151-447(+)
MDPLTNKRLPAWLSDGRFGNGIFVFAFLVAALSPCIERSKRLADRGGRAFNDVGSRTSNLPKIFDHGPLLKPIRILVRKTLRETRQTEELGEWRSKCF